MSDTPLVPAMRSWPNDVGELEPEARVRRRHDGTGPLPLGGAIAQAIELSGGPAWKGHAVHQTPRAKPDVWNTAP